jgi:hypothetical protein
MVDLSDAGTQESLGSHSLRDVEMFHEDENYILSQDDSQPPVVHHRSLGSEAVMLNLDSDEDDEEENEDNDDQSNNLDSDFLMR